MADPSDIFQIDQNFPTSGALLVPGPNQSSYTVFIYKYSDWSTGNQDTLFAIAQSGVNSDGTWKGVFNPFDQTYSAVTLPETEIDGSGVAPYTVVAINTNTRIVLGLKIIAPIPSPPGASSIILPTITVVASYAALSTDCVIIVNTAGTATITLPTTGVVAGQFFIVKTINTGVITVQGQTGTTDGNSSVVFHDQYTALTFSYDGTNFWIT